MRVRLGGHAVEVDEGTHPAFPDYWHAVERGEWEPHTLATITERLGEDSKFIDIGAWIGPTSLAAAASGATVVAYEPDPVARGRLERNLSLNPDLASRVTVRAVALADRDGASVIRSSVMGNSGSSLLYSGGEEANVDLADGARVAAEERFADADLIKIDIEGGEYALVPRIVGALRGRRPDLLLSTHVTYLQINRKARSGSSRSVVLRLRAIQQHMGLLWRLRFYRSWAVSDDGSWRQVGRFGAARLLMHTRNRDWLVTSG